MAPALTDSVVCELFIGARSLAGLPKAAARARADFFLSTRYRPLLEAPAAVARSRMCRWLLECAEFASLELVRTDERVLDLVVNAVWHADDPTRPLRCLGRVFDWRLRPLMLALSLDMQSPTTRAVEVCKWLVARTRPADADELCVLLVPTLKRLASTHLQGRDRSRCCALELLGEVALHAPQVSDTLAPFFWQALLLDTISVKEMVAAICFDVVFALLSRGAFADGSASRAEQRGFAPMLLFLPRMLLAPSVVMQRTAVAGVARLVWHAGEDEQFEKAIVHATGDECVCDELLLQLVKRYVNVQQPAGASSVLGSLASSRLTGADDREVLQDIDHALSECNQGLIADSAVYLVVSGIGSKSIDPESTSGFSDGNVQLRRMLHELVRRLSKKELRDGLSESIGSTCLDLFGIALHPERVWCWLGLSPHTVTPAARDVYRC